jgi:hypothetical protein
MWQQQQGMGRSMCGVWEQQDALLRTTTTGTLQQLQQQTRDCARQACRGTAVGGRCAW